MVWDDRGGAMLDESGGIIGLDIYGPKGVYIGKVSDLTFDPDDRRVVGLIVRDVSPAVSEPGVMVSIPYDWVSAIGDIVILKRFPEMIFRNEPPAGL